MTWVSLFIQDKKLGWGWGDRLSGQYLRFSDFKILYFVFVAENSHKYV